MAEAHTSPGGEEQVTPSGRRSRWSLRRARGKPGKPITADVATLYVVIALVWGFALIALVPPFQVPDEPAHFYRAWELAQLDYQAGTDGRVSLPGAVVRLPSDLGSGERSWSVSTYSSKRVRQYLFAPIGSQTASVDNASPYGPLGYLPHLLPIEAARLTGHGALAAFYGARLLNLIAAVLLTYLAIRVIPVGKLLIAVLGLLPMTMYETASASPDALAIAGSFLFVAVLLRTLSRASLERRDIAVLAASAALGLNVKPGYAVLVLAALAVPRRAFGSWRRYLSSMAIIIGSTAALAAVLLVTTPRSAPSALVKLLGPDNGVDSGRQLSHVLLHPWGFVQIMHRTLDLWGISYLKSFVGYFGWLTFWLPMTFLFLALLALAIAFSSPEEYRPRWWQRVILVGTAGLGAATTALALYITFTPFGAVTIEGLQGRYFIPCAPFFLLGLYRLPIERNGWRLLIFFVLLALIALATIVTITQYYY